LAEICQKRTADKGRIFRGFSVAQIKKCSPNESLDITWGICTRNRRSKRYTKNFHEFLWCSTENFQEVISQDTNKRKRTECNNFQDSNKRKRTECKNEIKRIRRGYYSSNNFQDSNKRKRTECKNIGLSPKSAFL
jgi:hypothetical protein